MPGLPEGWRYVEPQQPFNLNAAPPLPDYAAPEVPVTVNRAIPTGEEITTAFRKAAPQVWGDIQRGTSTFGQGALSGALFNFDDEILGFLRGVWPGGPTVSEATQQERERQAAVREQAPWLYTAGQVAGSIAPAAGAFKLGVSPLSGARPTFSSVVPRSTAEGGIYGALAGAGGGETPNERLTGAALGGAAGAAGGMVGGTMGQAISRYSRTSPYRTAPTAEELRAQYDLLREQARQVGLTLNDASYTNAVHQIDQAFLADFAPDLAPQTYARVQQLMTLPKDPTLEDVEVVRRLLSTISRNSNDPTERAAAISVRGQLDDYIQNLSPTDVISGDPQMVPDLLRQSRDVYRRLATSEFVEETISNAMLTATGRDTPAGAARAIRNAFANILRNDKLSRRFNDYELGLIQDVAQANTAEAILQALGGFSLEAVFTNPLRTALTLGASGLAGYAAGGPIGAAAVPAIGTAAGRAARGMTMEEANLLSAVIRSGQTASSPPLAALSAAAGARAPLAAPGAQELINYLAPPEESELPAGWRLLNERAAPPLLR